MRKPTNTNHSEYNVPRAVFLRQGTGIVDSLLTSLYNLYSQVKTSFKKEPASVKPISMHFTQTATDFHIMYVDDNLVCVTENSARTAIIPFCVENRISLQGLFQQHLPMNGEKVIGLHRNKFAQILNTAVAISGNNIPYQNEMARLILNEFQAASDRAIKENPVKFPKRTPE